MTKKVLFLDTNIFLHYQDFTQVDWLAIVDANSVKIIIPPITIRELNKHKDSHNLSHLRKRAGKIIKRLFKLIKQTNTNNIKENVDIVFEPRDPIINFGEYQLNSSIQDDQLIASVMMWKNENPEDDIILVTSDFGLALIMKANKFFISTIQMPDDLKLPEELDYLQKEIQNLKKENLSLKNRMPDIHLQFSTGDNQIKYTLSTPIDENTDEIQNKITELKKQFPHLHQSSKDTIISKSSISDGLSDYLSNDISDIEEEIKILEESVLNQISHDEYDRYNLEIENFYERYSEYLLKINKFKNLQKRTIRLDIALINVGNTPAEDIDVTLDFPDGFSLVEEFDLPQSPKEPNPPEKPMNSFEKLSRSLRLPIPYQSLLHDAPYFSPNEPDLNVTPPNIKQTNSYEVKFHVQKVKHNMVVEFSPLYIVFNTYSSANSFQIKYILNASNIPTEVSGELHIIIQKQ